MDGFLARARRQLRDLLRTLDPTGRREMLELVADVARKRKVNVFLSSHILNDIEQTCDHVVVLTEGRMHFAGSLEKFKHEKDRRIQVRVKSGHETMAAALREAGFRLIDTGGSTFLEVEMPEQMTIDRIWQLAKQHSLQIRHLAPTTGSLQRAFASAVNQGEHSGPED